MIQNITKNRILAKEFKECKSIISKAKGLMFSRKKSLVFVFDKETKVTLHMFFVFFPIDILFLDKNKKIVDLFENAKPFRSIIASKKPAKYIIELPAIKNSNTELGDIIKYQKDI